MMPPKLPDEPGRWLESRLRDCHEDDGGAVVFLALVACLLLFMIGMVLYDAGYIAREDVDTQMAADTAAYSQAAVKARAMNNIAFANVAKRTTVGIRNMYYYQYPAYMDWLDQQCNRCCCGITCGCWNECLNCWGNYLSLVPLFEGLDYAAFIRGRLQGDKITDYLETLDSYQKDMKTYAAYWALGEAIIRGVRNGGNYIATYPMPDNSQFGSLPLEKASGWDASKESCLAPSTLDPTIPSATTTGTFAEWDVNFRVLKDRSVSAPNMANKGPAEVVKRGNPAGGDPFQRQSFQACAELPISVDDEPARPMYLTAKGDNGRDYMKRSNIIWAFRANEALEGSLRSKFGFIDSDYQKKNRIRPRGGMWSMARSEIYFPPGNKPNILKSGRHEFWMFHPGWIGKLRPVALPREQMPVKPSKMWREASKTFSRLGALFGGRTKHFRDDQDFMDKAMRGMDGHIQGREVIDGIPK